APPRRGPRARPAPAPAPPCARRARAPCRYSTRTASARRIPPRGAPTPTNARVPHTTNRGALPVDNLQEQRILLVDRLEERLMPADRKSDLLQGTLDLMVLRTLAAAPNHGWGIAQQIQERSGDVFLVNQGSLYPSLHRLEEEGLVVARWGVSENNRRARIYELTKAGRRQLQTETATWERLAAAVARVLAPA